MTAPVFTLRVYHPSIDPREISAELGLPPVSCDFVGEPRITHGGKVLKGVHKESYWRTSLAGDESGRDDLAAGLRDICARLEPYRFFTERIRAEGGRLELFIGWFLDRNEGLELDRDVLAKLAALGIDLALDVYPPDAA